ncbi:unnamed protein product [Lampetra planeri]
MVAEFAHEEPAEEERAPELCGAESSVAASRQRENSIAQSRTRPTFCSLSGTESPPNLKAHQVRLSRSIPQQDACFSGSGHCKAAAEALPLPLVASVEVDTPENPDSPDARNAAISLHHAECGRLQVEDASLLTL